MIIQWELVEDQLSTFEIEFTKDPSVSADRFDRYIMRNVVMSSVIAF